MIASSSRQTKSTRMPAFANGSSHQSHLLSAPDLAPPGSSFLQQLAAAAELFFFLFRERVEALLMNLGQERVELLLRGFLLL